jgi:hypothetical protein
MPLRKHTTTNERKIMFKLPHPSSLPEATTTEWSDIVITSRKTPGGKSQYIIKAQGKFHVYGNSGVAAMYGQVGTRTFDTLKEAKEQF